MTQNTIEKQREVSNVRRVSLAGYYVPTRHGRPVVLRLPSDTRAIAVFSTQDRMTACLYGAGVEFDSSFTVTDEAAFVASVPASVRLIVDPTALDGSVRFGEVLRG